MNGRGKLVRLTDSRSKLRNRAINKIIAPDMLPNYPSIWLEDVQATLPFLRKLLRVVLDKARDKIDHTMLIVKIESFHANSNDLGGIRQ